MGMSSESDFARPDAQGERVELPPPKNRAWRPCTQRWAKKAGAKSAAARVKFCGVILVEQPSMPTRCF